MPPPRIIKQPQACSISQSFLAASVARASLYLQVPGSQRQSLSTRVLAAETSTHLESATASHREATAASLLDQSELHGGFRCRASLCLHVPWSRRQALSTRVLMAETSTHLESATASHHRAAASLLDQSELHGGFRLQSIYLPVPGLRRQALSTRVLAAETSTHLESATASHRGAAASLLDSWCFYCRANCRCLSRTRTFMSHAHIVFADRHRNACVSSICSCSRRAIADTLSR